MKVKYHEVKNPIVLKSKSAQTRTHIYVYHVMKNNNQINFRYFLLHRYSIAYLVVIKFWFKPKRIDIILFEVEIYAP